MDATRIHLFITHLPVFGLFLGLIVLGYAFFLKDTQLKVVALALIFIAAVGGLLPFKLAKLLKKQWKI